MNKMIFGKKYKDIRTFNIFFMLTVIFGFTSAYYGLGELAAQAKTEFVSPLPEHPPIILERQVPVEVPQEDIDTWVGEYTDQYFNDYRRSEVRMIMHCLLHRESGHASSDAHGDNGKAGGPLQFWNDTWVRMRTQMIKQGKTNEIGSRYDHEQAIHTAIWAIANGHALEWGPVNRYAQGSDFATCQVPSWY